jgi:hypothetical protein
MHDSLICNSGKEYEEIMANGTKALGIINDKRFLLDSPVMQAHAKIQFKENYTLNRN